MIPLKNEDVSTMSALNPPVTFGPSLTQERMRKPIPGKLRLGRDSKLCSEMSGGHSTTTICRCQFDFAWNGAKDCQSINMEVS